MDYKERYNEALDGAANAFAWKNFSNNHAKAAAIRGFKAGAEWAFGQGVTFESVVLPYNGAKTIEMFPDDLFDGFEYDDKVIVQIRKKN